MKPFDASPAAPAKDQERPSSCVLTVYELEFIRRLARIAAQDDYKHFCETGRILSYGEGEESL
jgi:hypothetical protein